MVFIKKIPDINSLIQQIVDEKNTRIFFNKSLNDNERHKLSRLAMNITHNLSIYINKTFFKYDGIKGVSNGYVKLWVLFHMSLA